MARSVPRSGSGLFKQFRAEVLPDVDQCTDEHMVRPFRVKNVVRLETEAAVANDEFVGVGPYSGKVSNQPEGALQSRVIGIGLVAAKIRV